MKYCHHCGKQVSEEMQFCAECGTKLVVEKEQLVVTQEVVPSEPPKTEEVEQTIEKEKVTELEMEQLFIKWQKDTPKNNFIVEKLAWFMFLIKIIGFVIGVALIVAAFLYIKKTGQNETLSDMIIETRIAEKIKSCINALVILALFVKIFTSIPNPCRFVRISMADYIKKENLNRREMIKGITQGKITAADYVELPTDAMFLSALFADSVFISSSDAERSNYVRGNLISIALQLVGMITFAMGVLELLPFIDTIFGGFSSSDLISEIVGQPLFYISIGCWIGNGLFCSKIEKNRNKRKMEWLKNEACDLFSDLKIAGKK